LSSEETEASLMWVPLRFKIHIVVHAPPGKIHGDHRLLVDCFITGHLAADILDGAHQFLLTGQPHRLALCAELGEGQCFGNVLRLEVGHLRVSDFQERQLRQILQQHETSAGDFGADQAQALQFGQVAEIVHALVGDLGAAEREPFQLGELLDELHIGVAGFCTAQINRFDPSLGIVLVFDGATETLDGLDRLLTALRSGGSRRRDDEP
jgi:hypothetical protein